MKQILLCGFMLTLLVACKEKGDTTTPKGTIISAVQALSSKKTEQFKALLDERALEQYGTKEQQKQLLKEFGNVRDLKLGEEKVISHKKKGSTVTTVSSVDVLRDSQIVRTVIVKCQEVTTQTTTRVCKPTYPTYPDHDDDNGHWRPDPTPPPRYEPEPDDDYLTPGRPHEPTPGAPSDDGHKPGNQDPDRPPRFPIVNFRAISSGETCEDVVDTNIVVSCKIIDLK